MTISVIHPSSRRPEMAKATIEKWLGSASNDYIIQYIVATDNSEPRAEDYAEMISDVKGKYNLGGSKLYIEHVINDTNTAIEAINEAAKITIGDMIVVVSDDFDCPPEWDRFLVKQTEGRTDFLVNVEDGYRVSDQPYIITLPIIDRHYFRRTGFIYHPDYKHMFADTDMSCVGILLGKVINLRNTGVVFKHNHYTTGEMVKDSVNHKNDVTWDQGKATFFARRENKFNLKPEQIVGVLPEKIINFQ